MNVIGTGVHEPTLKNLIRELNLEGVVKLLGGLSEADKDSELRDAHFLLHTSIREGWGLNVIEANAMGTPGAVYPVDGLVESTLNNETGILSHAESPASLADAICDSIRRPGDYERWRRAAWLRAKTFHWHQVLPAAADWIESMARDQK